MSYSGGKRKWSYPKAIYSTLAQFFLVSAVEYVNALTQGEKIPEEGTFIMAAFKVDSSSFLTPWQQARLLDSMVQYHFGGQNYRQSES